MNSFVRSWCLLMAIAGIALGAVLLQLHHSSAVSEGWMGSICGAGSGCDRVLQSPWSHFPPVESGPRVPVALVGVAYFLAMAVWFLGFGFPSRVNRELDGMVAALMVSGLLGSIGFICLMAFVVHGICPWCLATHIVNAAMVIPGLAAWWRHRLDPAGEIIGEHRSRSVGLAVLTVLSLWLAAGLGYGWFGAAQRADQLRSSLSEIEQEGAALEMAFYNQPAVDLELREDAGAEGVERDPTMDASPGYRNTMVIFGDAECSACRRFHQLLEQEIRPAYGDHLRIIFKHRPLSDLHPEALKAAAALEAARDQGKFWEMLESLYERQEELAGMDYGQLAKILGMNRDEFVKTMESPEIAQRIRSDQNLADRLGIDGTPVVYLNGRRVTNSIRNLPGFWISQANRLKTLRSEKGQGWIVDGLAGVMRP